MSEQRIFGFHNPHITKVMGKGHVELDGARQEAIKKEQTTLAVGEIVSFDVSPTDKDGRPYPGNDPTVQGWKRLGSTPGPAIQGRWGYDRDGRDVLLTNSGHDKFAFGSVDDDGGTTPTLKLEEQVGEGSNRCFFYYHVEAEDNGGVEQNSARIHFRAD